MDEEFHWRCQVPRRSRTRDRWNCDEGWVQCVEIQGWRSRRGGILRHDVPGMRVLQGGVDCCTESKTRVFNDIDVDGTITRGGFSDLMQANQRYVFKIPDALASDVAAPLLCAGICVYTPMIRHGMNVAGKKLGVIGLGGGGPHGSEVWKSFRSACDSFQHIGVEEKSCWRAGSGRIRAEQGRGGHEGCGEELGFRHLCSVRKCFTGSISCGAEAGRGSRVRWSWEGDEVRPV